MPIKDGRGFVFSNWFTYAQMDLNTKINKLSSISVSVFGIYRCKG